MIKKFPKDEMLNLASDMKAAAFSAMESLIYAKVTNSNKQKILYITSAEAKLNILNILVRLAKKNKFITQRNYNVWSFKITEISDMLRKWRSFCQNKNFLMIVLHLKRCMMLLFEQERIKVINLMLCF